MAKELEFDRYQDLTNRQYMRLLSDVEMGVLPEEAALEAATAKGLVKISEEGIPSLTSVGKKLLDTLRPPFLQVKGSIYQAGGLSDNALLDKLYKEEWYAYELGQSSKVSPKKVERVQKNIKKLRDEAEGRGLSQVVHTTVWEAGPPSFWEWLNGDEKKADVNPYWEKKIENLLDDLFNVEVDIRQLKIDNASLEEIAPLEDEAKKYYQELVEEGFKQQALDVIEEAADPTYY